VLIVACLTAATLAGCAANTKTEPGSPSTNLPIVAGKVLEQTRSSAERFTVSVKADSKDPLPAAAAALKAAGFTVSTSDHTYLAGASKKFSVTATTTDGVVYYEFRKATDGSVPFG
jgi:hypothetical protein